MNKSVYYAKPDQTYEEHIRAVYIAWKQVVAYKKINKTAVANVRIFRGRIS